MLGTVNKIAAKLEVTELKDSDGTAAHRLLSEPGLLSLSALEGTLSKTALITHERSKESEVTRLHPGEIKETMSDTSMEN